MLEQTKFDLNCVLLIKIVYMWITQNVKNVLWVIETHKLEHKWWTWLLLINPVKEDALITGQ